MALIKSRRKHLDSFSFWTSASSPVSNPAACTKFWVPGQRMECPRTLVSKIVFSFLISEKMKSLEKHFFPFNQQPCNRNQVKVQACTLLKLMPNKIHGVGQMLIIKGVLCHTMEFGLKQHTSPGTLRFDKIKNILWEFKLQSSSSLSSKTEPIFFINIYAPTILVPPATQSSL